MLSLGKNRMGKWAYPSAMEHSSTACHSVRLGIFCNEWASTASTPRLKFTDPDSGYALLFECCLSKKHELAECSLACLFRASTRVLVLFSLSIRTGILVDSLGQDFQPMNRDPPWYSFPNHREYVKQPPTEASWSQLKLGCRRSWFTCSDIPHCSAVGHHASKLNWVELDLDIFSPHMYYRIALKI